MLFLFFAILTVIAALPTKRDVPQDVPEYVVTYAPILYLHSQETYFPSDIAAQVSNTIAEVDNKAVETKEALTLDNLDSLNSKGGASVYLTSKEGILALPSWFNGAKPGDDLSKIKSSSVIVIDKPSVGVGVTDVFYFYFYAYNLGNNVNVFGKRLGNFGNHVGDWEHVMIRFKDGKPQGLWLSQHSGGEAFTYDAMEKEADRPVIYVGDGTHANWAITGPHEHTIPGLTLPFNGLLTDQTDKGPSYDSIPSSYFYKYDGTTFSAYDASPVNWLSFQGQWGDQQLPDDTKGQVNLFGQRKYSGGPNGPIFKDLMRKDVCPTSKNQPCILRPIAMPKE